MKTVSIIVKYTGLLTVVYTFIGLIAGAFDHVLVFYNTELPLIDLNLALILIPFGIFCLILGKLMEKKWNDFVDAPPVLDTNDLLFIEDAIRKTARRNLWVGLFLLLAGIGFSLVPLADEEATFGMSITVIVIGILCIFLGIFMIYKYFDLRDVKNTRIWKILMLEPKTISELNIQTYQHSSGMGATATNANLIVNGKIIGTLAVNEKELLLLTQYLIRHNPEVKIDQRKQ